MRTKTFVLLGASLTLILGFSSCSFPAGGGGTATGGEGVPVEPAAPAAPTNTDGAETILIPGGTFWMGSEESDAEAQADEMPRHQVTLGGFRIYTHEVTQGMYARCVEAGVCIPVDALESGPTSHYGDPAFADHPVTGVDWLMARDYCTWANGRLPTEAEWELASRSTDSFRFPWGEEEPTCERANMYGCSVPPDTLAVGSLALGNSAYEVWDLSGNVWEWVQDWYDEDFYFFSSVINPLGPNYSETKVVRGGGLYSEPVQMRSAARLGGDPHRTYDDVGFRCVAMGPLDLPLGYVPVDEVHERVPPDSLEGGGDHVEDYDPDPDWWVTIGRIRFSCPMAGDMTISFPLTATGPATLTASMDGVPWACRIDPATELATCEGAVPDGYGGSGTVLMEWCIEVEGGGTTCGAWTLRLPNPEDCESPGSPVEFSASATCPERGLVIGYLEYEPPVDWHLVQLDGADIPWWRISETEIGCFLPERPWEEPYQLHLVGTDAEGDTHGWWPLVYLPTDCPATATIVGVFPDCLGDRAMVRVGYPEDVLTLVSVSAEGAPLDCIPTAPGAEMCGDLPGDAGSSTTVTVCFEEEPCEDRTLTVPACPSTGSEIDFTIETGCALPTRVQAAIITYSPTDQALVSADVDGSPLPCYPTSSGPGVYGCSPVPGAPGSEVTITFCLADGTCWSRVVTLRGCEGEEPSGGDWRLVDAGCHSETHIYFIVDTGLDWLVPGADYTYYAMDGETMYSCSVVPSVPGRLYCSSPRPGGPGTLEVCVRQEGASSPTCSTFSDWAAQEDTIPDCAAPPPPAEFSCSSILDSGVCEADPRCRWEIKVDPSCIPG